MGSWSNLGRKHFPPPEHCTVLLACLTWFPAVRGCRHRCDPEAALSTIPGLLMVTTAQGFNDHPDHQRASAESENAATSLQDVPFTEHAQRDRTRQ